MKIVLFVSLCYLVSSHYNLNIFVHGAQINVFLIAAVKLLIDVQFDLERELACLLTYLLFLAFLSLITTMIIKCLNVCIKSVEDSKM